MPATHNVRIEANADGIAVSEFIAELFQYRNIVNIDDDAKFFAFFNLRKINAVWREQNPVRCETGFQS